MQICAVINGKCCQLIEWRLRQGQCHSRLGITIQLLQGALRETRLNPAGDSHTSNSYALSPSGNRCGKEHSPLPNKGRVNPKSDAD